MYLSTLIGYWRACEGLWLYLINTYWLLKTMWSISGLSNHVKGPSLHDHNVDWLLRKHVSDLCYISRLSRSRTNITNQSAYEMPRPWGLFVMQEWLELPFLAFCPLVLTSFMSWLSLYVESLVTHYEFSQANVVWWVQCKLASFSHWSLLLLPCILSIRKKLIVAD